LFLSFLATRGVLMAYLPARIGRVGR
jgi:hypothetical protein